VKEGRRTGALSGMKRSPMTSTRREVILDPAPGLNDPFPSKRQWRESGAEAADGRLACTLRGELQRSVGPSERPGPMDGGGLGAAEP